MIVFWGICKQYAWPSCVSEVGGTCKMNIEMALKSRSYILDLDHVKLSLGIFFLLGFLMESFLHELSGYTLIFVKNTNPQI